ncbi:MULTISPECIES: RrF2 family transcriptional regulator [Pseudofrankia]|uniref:RrF2 family transcriptional regulator n=1 Tax=Pseudofrankia TaxID=2994363 RepID=UPI000234CDE3|nr:MULTISPECIES: Rrf2 family transcriptional regulator [Pseudofrankia]OHV35311.1 Rrf2 family transcriptional regulator [Pseudofrankia sp. EUN1h]
MRLPESTEWLLHCAVTLALLKPGQAASAGQLAGYYDLPLPSLAKQLQALVRAGVLTATTGPRGGFRLARDPADITVLEVVEGVDGAAAPYRCREIRQHGLGALPTEDCAAPCVLATTMARAHQAWRDSLGSVSLADIVSDLPPGAPGRTRRFLPGR